MFFWIGAAIVLRVLSAFLSLGGSHPNEFYRLLEPIAALQGYSTRLPWEWTDGLLSTLPVRAHAVLLSALATVGMSNPLTQLVAIKLLYAAFSLLPLWATWRLLSRFAPRWAWLGVAILGLWPELIYRSVHLMDYSLEAPLLALAVGISFGAKNDERLARWIVAGACLGLAFFVRFQSGLYLVAFVFALAVSLPRQLSAQTRKIAALVASYGVVVMGLAFLESRLDHRPFLDPFWKYLGFNWVQDGAAQLYGRAPWHRYIGEAAKYYGFLPFVLGLGLCACAAFKKSLNSQLAILFFFPLVVFTLISHKEGRFIYGFLWLFVPLALTSLESVAVAGWNKRATAVLTALLLGGFVINLHRTIPVYWAGSQVVRDWTALGDQLQKQGESVPIIVQGDPDFLPGSFFLRPRAPICYRYEIDHKLMTAGECKLNAAQLLLGSAGWELKR